MTEKLADLLFKAMGRCRGPAGFLRFRTTKIASSDGGIGRPCRPGSTMLCESIGSGNCPHSAKQLCHEAGTSSPPAQAQACRHTAGEPAAWADRVGHSQQEASL